MPDVKIDSRQVAELESVFGEIAPKELKKSMNRALTRTRRRAKTESTKKIRERYNIPVARANKDTILTRPNYQQFFFRVIGRKKPIGLISFKPGRPRQTAKGVTVAVEKKKRKLIRRAFIAKGVNGNTQVFTRFTPKGQPLPYRRTTYQGRSGRLRQKIRSIQGPSVSDMMIGSDVAAHLGGILADTFSAELERNLRLLLKR